MGRKESNQTNNHIIDVEMIVLCSSYTYVRSESIVHLASSSPLAYRSRLFPEKKYFLMLLTLSSVFEIAYDGICVKPFFGHACAAV